MLFASKTNLPSRVFLFTIIFFAVSACEWGFNEKETMQKARQYHESGKYNAAVIELKKVLKNNAASKDARVLLAKSYLELEQGASAEKELRFAQKSGMPMSEIADLWGQALLKQNKFEQIFKDVPLSATKDARKRSELMLVHGYAKLAQKDNSAAKSLFEKVKKENYIAAKANVALAVLAISERDITLARSYIDTALSIDQKNTAAWLAKGQILLQKGNTKEAAEAFEKVVELSELKRSPFLEFRARVFLVRLALAAKNMELAKEKADQLHTATPNHPLSKYLSAMVAYQNHEYENARTLLEKVLLMAPDDLQSKLLLGAVHYAQGNYELANKYLNIYVEKVPTHIQARKLLAAVQVKLGYGEDAYQSLKSALNSNQNDSDLLAMIGKTAIYSKRSDEAIDYLKQAKKAKPESTQIRTELAKAYIMKGSFDDAIEELKNVTGEEAKQARNMLVYAHLKNKDIKSARKLTKQLIKESPKSPVPYTLAGTVELTAGNRDKAKVNFQQALEKEADFIPALLSLARILYEDNDLAESEKHYNKILKKDEGNEKAYIGLATIAERKNEADKSVALLEKALSKKPDALTIGLGLGQYYLKTKQYEKGLKVLSSISAHHGDKPKVISALVQAQLLAGKKQDALATAQSMIKKWSNLPVGYVEQARVQIALDQNNQAENSLETALKIKPDLIPAKTGLVSLYLKTGKKDKALSYARQIQKQHPKLVIGHMLAGEIHMSAKKYHLAQKEFQSALTKQKSPRIIFNLAKAYKLAGQSDKAVKILQDWLKENPSDTKTRMQLAVLFSKTNDSKNAMAQYQLLLKSDPQNLAILNNLAVLYMDSDINKASGYAKKAYTMKPDIAAIADTYGWILYKTGKTESALPILKEAANKSEHPSIHYHYAVVLTKSGKGKEAKVILERLISKDFEEVQDAQKLYRSL